MKLMIAGGGTGGHLFPGVAVARLCQAHGGEVFFVGTARGLESKVVPQAGFKLSLIGAQVGLKNRGAGGLLKALLMLPRSFWQSLAIVRREKAERRARRGRLRGGTGDGGRMAAACAVADSRAERDAGTDQSHPRRDREKNRFSFMIGRASTFRLANSCAKAFRCAPSLRRRWPQQNQSGSRLAAHFRRLARRARFERRGDRRRTGARRRRRFDRSPNRQGRFSTRVRRLCFAAARRAQSHRCPRIFIDDMAAAYGHCDLVVLSIPAPRRSPNWALSVAPSILRAVADRC